MRPALAAVAASLLPFLAAAPTPAAAAPATVPAPATRPAARQESAAGITHGLLVLGNATYILDAAGTVVWTYPAGTRDGFVLPDGNVLLALSKSKSHPGGAAVEVTRDGATVWAYEGTQAEVNTVQKVTDPAAKGPAATNAAAQVATAARYVLTEAGPHPRVVDVDAAGAVVATSPIQAQTKDLHLQTRMARRLPTGRTLVPQLLDQVVREYAPDGTVAWEAAAPADPKECWPFTAVRLPTGNTLCTLTHGAEVVEFDPAGHVAWRLTNADLPAPLLKDPCGVQRLPNGNTVVAAYGQGRPGEVKLLEVTRDKRLVWTLRDDRPHGVHEFQVLDAAGRPVEPVLK